MKTRESEADEQLLVEAAQRDPACFAALYEANFERVYAFIAGRVRHRDQAEDLTSEVFHKALAHLGRFEWRGAPFAAWLYRIAANTIANHTGGARREHEVLAADDPPGVATAPEIQPETEEGERRARLFRMVKSLPVDQRRVVNLRFSEEKSISEIAQEMGRSEGAVKQLQFRALETLRKRMTSRSGGARA
ncbi:MAG TPA: sigma-70 family RNA polymerase sigma factor [Terriglobia bacterium]|nr:sigma-70 family RNA polymerase sigma factor [Terriglobia bacterium]